MTFWHKIKISVILCNIKLYVNHGNIYINVLLTLKFVFNI